MSQKRNVFLQLCRFIVVMDCLLLAVAIGLKETGLLTPIIMSYDTIFGGKLNGGTVDVGWSLGTYSLYFPIFVPLMAILAIGLLCAGWAHSRRSQ